MDQFGEILPVTDLMAWFGLDKDLTPHEQHCIKHELAALAESQVEMEKLTLSEELHSGTSY